MAKIAWKPSTLLAPMPPVMVSCGDMDNSNIITIAWTGIVNTSPAMTYISVRKERYSYDIIRSSGEFVVNLSTTALARAADFCGVKSGANVDKFKEMNLTKEPVGIVKCPAIAECPLNLECKVEQVIELGSHDMFLAKILAVNVDSKLLSPDGKLMLDKAGLLAFAHGEYFELGRSIGTFGFSVKKPVKKSKPHNKPRK